MSLDLVIHGGTLVTAADTVQADLGIKDGRIALIGHDLHDLGASEMIDAHGKLVIPGAVDPHVHLQMPTGATVSSDDWYTGTVAAACGGTTTVIDFVEPQTGQPLLEALAARRAEADGRAVIDYGLHMTLDQSALTRLDELGAVVETGVPSFKTYTTYDGFKLGDGELLDAMRAVRSVGGMVLTHCENDAIVQDATGTLLAAGHTGPQSHPRSRPAVAEAEAVQRVTALAEYAGVPLYVVHVSTARGMQALAQARARGQEVYGETCPQYLLLDEAAYDRPDFEGAKAVCSPPLRTQADQAALWEGLAAGVLSTVGTDHCPFHFAGQKDLGRDDFSRIPGGLPGIEARLALLYTFGVRTGRLTLNRWVDVCCTTPARVFGLYPRKGTLAPGADADVVIFDPEREVTITHDLLHEHVDYTPYEGAAVCGYPVKTISRGRVVADDGVFTGISGHGTFLLRATITNP